MLPCVRHALAGALALAPAALFADTARWTGPYVGATIGSATGTAAPLIGATTGATSCLVGGTAYGLTDRVYHPSGGYLLQLPRQASSPSDTQYYINVGYGLNGSALGLVPIGTPVDLSFTGFVTTAVTSSGYRLDALPVQPLSYTAGNILALVDQRTTIFNGSENIANPFDCVILQSRAGSSLPPGAVAFQFEDGTIIEDADAVGGTLLLGGSGGDRGSVGLSGTPLSLLGGYNWAIGPNMIAGIEARSFVGAIEGDGAALDMLSMAQGRFGYVQGPTLIFLSAGLALAEIEVTTAGGTGQDWATGIAVGSGVEVALTETLAARLDVTYAVFDGRDYVATDDTEVDATIASVGVVWRF